MAKYKLDEEEQEILDAFESGKIQPIPSANEEMEKHKKYAAATLKKRQKIKYSSCRSRSCYAPIIQVISLSSLCC